MAFSRKGRLEEQEVKDSENWLIRNFAADNVVQHPKDSMADALELVTNREPTQNRPQRLVEIPFRAKWASFYEDIPV